MCSPGLIYAACYIADTVWPDLPGDGGREGLGVILQETQKLVKDGRGQFLEPQRLRTTGRHQGLTQRLESQLD